MSETSLSSSLKNSTADEARIKNYRTMLEQKNEMELREMEARHADEVQRLAFLQTNQLENLRNAYSVRISEEAEALEEKLHEVRLKNAQRIDIEKHSADDEVAKIRTANQLKIDEYRKNSELQVEALHKQLQANTDALHEQAKKSARRERENSTHESFQKGSESR